MKQHLLTIVMAALMAGMMSSSAFAQDEGKTLLGDYLSDMGVDVEVSASLDYYDKYVWRGTYLDKDNVIQPGIAISAAGFETGYWGSYDLENEDGLASDEIDFWISYTYDLEDFSFTAGHTWYDFPEAGSSSKEFFFSVAWDTFLSPAFTFVHDYEDGKDLNTDGDGNYYAFDISHSIPLIEDYGVTLDLASTLGIIDGQWLSGEGGHITSTLGVTVPLTPTLTATPTVGYNMPFGDLEDDSIGAIDDDFFGGVSMAYSF